MAAKQKEQCEVDTRTVLALDYLFQVGGCGCGSKVTGMGNGKGTWRQCRQCRQCRQWRTEENQCAAQALSFFGIIPGIGLTLEI